MSAPCSEPICDARGHIIGVCSHFAPHDLYPHRASVELQTSEGATIEADVEWSS